MWSTLREVSREVGSIGMRLEKRGGGRTWSVYWNGPGLQCFRMRLCSKLHRPLAPRPRALCSGFPMLRGCKLKTCDRYLQSRYRVSWNRLRTLDHPLRIGEVLILPKTAFAPETHGANSRRHMQADVRHLCECLVHLTPKADISTDTVSSGKLEDKAGRLLSSLDGRIGIRECIICRA